MTGGGESRYLQLLRDALLNAHYPENELRIEYLLECLRDGREPVPAKLADPARHMASRLRELGVERRTGELPAGRASAADVYAYAASGRVRLDDLAECLSRLRDEGVKGDLLDIGPGRGGTAIFMRGYLEAHGPGDSKVWVVDRFDGRDADRRRGAFPPDLNAVREGFARFDLLDERVAFLQGAPEQMLAASGIKRVALVRIGVDDPEELRAILEVVYPRVAPGGLVVVDAHAAAGCADAVDSFRAAIDAGPLQRIDWSAARWEKPATPAGAELRPAADADSSARPQTPELAIVVAVYNMRREAARTLHSLSRSYQRDVDDLDYEVIVVENGSDHDQRLGDDYVQSFGDEFRYIDLGEDAQPSPAAALNAGARASDAATVAFMIDGAHVLTPGVLRFGMLGLETYAPAIAIVKQWYVGPGQQPQMVTQGYDSELEDRLFDRIQWPANGYRLFEVGHFIGNRDWFDGDWESNCLFVPRVLLEQVGTLDEAFDSPGGGFLNLDFFERLVGTPDVTLVTLLGEGSFHQVHGGTTTNTSEPYQLVRGYDDHYEELRGRSFQVPPQRAHYIGSLQGAARRTKARRLKRFDRFREADLLGGATASPMPVPQDLRNEFIDAFWRSGEWHRGAWLGRQAHRAPTDLLVYQELVFRLRPDWIIETRTGAGGLALFLASICDLVGRGRVLSIDGVAVGTPPGHERIMYLQGDPAAEETAARAREILGEGVRGLVVLGGASSAQIVGAFENLSPFVPVGSYVIVEDTILEGNPVWPDFGSGPSTAVEQLADGGSFVPDPSLERFALTFNPGGFLKRVR